MIDVRTNPQRGRLQFSLAAALVVMLVAGLACGMIAIFADVQHPDFVVNLINWGLIALATHGVASVLAVGVAEAFAQ